MSSALNFVGRRFGRISLVVACLFAGQSALAAGARPLIEMEGGKAKAALAKSWKKVKEGEYQFELDLTQEIKKDTKVSVAAVKNGLESKLGSEGVKVLEKGASTVVVTYKGDEKAFLDKIAKTKIRGTKNVELALESSVSEGSIRAKTLDRPATEGEVKGFVVAVKGDLMTVKVRDSKYAAIKVNDRIKVKTEGSTHKVKDLMFFMPDKKDGDYWSPKANSIK
jgi:multidrug efflux pump subunit AcrB